VTSNDLKKGPQNRLSVILPVIKIVPPWAALSWSYLPDVVSDPSLFLYHDGSFLGGL
jgi:hypothetical protein